MNPIPDDNAEKARRIRIRHSLSSARNGVWKARRHMHDVRFSDEVCDGLTSAVCWAMDAWLRGHGLQPDASQGWSSMEGQFCTHANPELAQEGHALFTRPLIYRDFQDPGARDLQNVWRDNPPAEMVERVEAFVTAVTDDIPAPGVSHLRARKAELLLLRGGWYDGTQGTAFDARWLSDVVAFLEDVCRGRAIPAPHLYPSPEGDLLAEWTLGPWEVSVEFPPRSQRFIAHGVNVEAHGEDERHGTWDSHEGVRIVRDFLTRFLETSTGSRG